MFNNLRKLYSFYTAQVVGMGFGSVACSSHAATSPYVEE
jgi:hypothetical protein